MKRRIEKVSELLKEQLAILIKASLPESLGLVTVTEVIVANDLKNATIYVSALNEKDFPVIFKYLEEEKLNYQRILGQRLKMRYTPRLNFKEDKSLDQINRVENILEEIKKNK